MHLRRVLFGAGIAIASLLVIRELGMVDWNISSGRNETTTGVSESPGSDFSRIRLSAYDERVRVGPWQTIAVPGMPAYTIHYASGAVYPWTRWLPLVKIGQTRVQYAFFVTSGEKPIFCGKSGASGHVHVFGSLSARKFEQIASADAFKDLCDTIKSHLDQIDEKSVAAKVIR